MIHPMITIPHVERSLLEAIRALGAAAHVVQDLQGVPLKRGPSVSQMIAAMERADDNLIQAFGAVKILRAFNDE